MKRRNFNAALLASAAGVCLPSRFALADEKLEGKACRSVHLGYQAAPSTAFYAEVAAKKSAAGTYFMVCGWNTGYFGMQELGNGKKVILFSVWDPGEQNDPKKVDEKDRVKLVERDEAVRIGRFGNEGTGGQSFFDYEWKLEETYRFMVTAKQVEGEDRTAFTGYFYIPESKSWKKLVTFSRVGGWQPLKGCYSFIEDFRRNKESAKQARVANFGNVWTKRVDGQWTLSPKARFTGDGNPAKNVSASLDGDRYRLATGGETGEHADRLNQWIELKTEGKPSPPDDLPS